MASEAQEQTRFATTEACFADVHHLLMTAQVAQASGSNAAAALSSASAGQVAIQCRIIARTNALWNEILP